MRALTSVPDLVELALHAACKAVQDELGVTDGGLASVMVPDDIFSDDFIDYVYAERQGCDGFEDHSQGIMITDPLMSSCGRFNVDPVEEYGTQFIRWVLS